MKSARDLRNKTRSFLLTFSAQNAEAKLAFLAQPRSVPALFITWVFSLFKVGEHPTRLGGRLPSHQRGHEVDLRRVYLARNRALLSLAHLGEVLGRRADSGGQCPPGQLGRLPR